MINHEIFIYFDYLTTMDQGRNILNSKPFQGEILFELKIMNEMKYFATVKLVQTSNVPQGLMP